MDHSVDFRIDTLPEPALPERPFDFEEEVREFVEQHYVESVSIDKKNSRHCLMILVTLEQ